ncbi:MAG: SDR family oxidoreductase [Spirochaetales bacterium]|nr:SDR family oxidoreductase [Spirochaetales bacterium]
MNSEINLEKRVAVITGAARGIGKEIARKFVQHGASVVIADVLKDDGKATAEELGESASFWPCDISKFEDVRRLIDYTTDRFKRLDILVNNAALNPSQAEHRVTGDAFSETYFADTIDVDINGTFYCSKLAARYMREQRGGNIINIASIAGVVPLQKQIGHVVGKGGIIKMTEALAVELGPFGIRVNSISPGSTVTAATRALFYGQDASYSKMAEELLSFIPLRRPGQTEDIANAALFLASDLSSYVTGHNLVVDGGWTCGFVRNF